MVKIIYRDNLPLARTSLEATNKEVCRALSSIWKAIVQQTSM